MAKVVHIIHEGSGGGGATAALSYFPRYRDHFATVAITGCAGSLPDRLSAAGLVVHALPLDRPLRCLLSIPAIALVLRSEKPDLAIIHGQWGGFAGAVAAWLAGIRRVIYYTHMPCFYTDWDFYRILRNRFVERITCAIASRVVCLSEAARYQYLLRHLVAEEKVIHIPNAIDTTRISPAPDKAAVRRELNLPLDGPLVVSVGRLEDQKRLDWLLKAWQEVEEKIPAACLCLVGDGGDRQGLEILARSLGLKRCLFLGRQPDGYRYFQAADAGVITSMFEGQPMSLLEAMACGCPMIGTAADGIAETIVQGETGYCVPVADPAALSLGIRNLLGDLKQAAQMGIQARAHVTRRFGLEDILKKQIDLALETLSNS